MIKAIKSIQRSYLRAPLRSFVLSQKQFQSKSVVPQQTTAMQHKIKEAK